MSRWISVAILILAMNPVNASDEKWDGAIDEDAFRKLHELRGDEAPATRGIEVQLGNTIGYLSLPEKTTEIRSAVIVFHEWWGLNTHIKHWADRLATDGHVALAVDLYGGKVAKNSREAMTLMREVKNVIASRSIADAIRFVHRDERVRADRVGTIGWCFGGTWSLKAAMAHPGIDACVLYYGKTPADSQKLSAIGGSVLAIFGKSDPSIPEQQIEAFRKGLKEAKVKHEILLYEAGHAFANPSSGRYVGEAAGKAWTQVRKFFISELQTGEKSAEKAPTDE